MPAAKRHGRFPGGSVLAALVARLVESAAGLGAGRPQLLRAAGATEAELRDPDARLPLERYLRVWEEVDRQLPEAPVAVACARAEKAADFGLVGYLVQQSPTLGEALETLVRYQRLYHEGVGQRLERDGAAVRATFPLSPRLRAVRPVAESCAASWVAGMRLLIGDAWRPRRVELPGAEPACAPALRDFFGAEVLFSRPRCLVELRAADLLLPLHAPDPALAVWLRAQADATLARLGEVRPLSEAVARRLVEALPRGGGSQAAIARELGVGDRTLQRRLAAEGTTFAALLEQSRRQLAEGFLRDQHLSASEVAFLLGYADPSTFFRAFKRWTGRTPQQFRAAR